VLPQCLALGDLIPSRPAPSPCPTGRFRLTPRRAPSVSTRTPPGATPSRRCLFPDGPLAAMRRCCGPAGWAGWRTSVALGRPAGVSVARSRPQDVARGYSTPAGLALSGTPLDVIQHTARNDSSRRAGRHGCTGPEILTLSAVRRTRPRLTVESKAVAVTRAVCSQCGSTERGGRCGGDGNNVFVSKVHYGL